MGRKSEIVLWAERAREFDWEKERESLMGRKSERIHIKSKKERARKSNKNRQKRPGHFLIGDFGTYL